MIKQIVFECNYCLTIDECRHKKKAGGDSGDFCLHQDTHGGLWICKSVEAQKEFLKIVGII